MAGFVLVHGAWHGAWCWQEVIPSLEAEGQAVEAIDLPGHGTNGAPSGSIRFEDYVDAVCAAVERAPRPTVLVGHSFGGFSITQAAERLGDRIDLLVYVGAFLPLDGQAVGDLAAAPEFAPSLALANLVVAEEAGTSSVAPQAVRETLFNTCEDSVADWASGRLVPESLAAQAEPVSIGPDRGCQVPRMYVKTLRDRAVPPTMQQAMIAAATVAAERSIDSDHSPFISAPAELVGHLLDAAAMADSTAELTEVRGR